jgi:tRNA (guanine-N7-)-methyltransferase
MRQSHFYGRRQSRPLKTNQQALWNKYFPALLFTKELWENSKFWRYKEVCLEIGFGSGEHLIQQAINNPDKVYIGCDPFINGVASLLQKIDHHQLGNILVFPDSINLLIYSLPDECLNEVVLLFADPWPKKRHNKRRFVQSNTIKTIHRILKIGGVWKIATDHTVYQGWIQEHFAQPEIQLMFRQERPDIWQRPDLSIWPETRYEQKANQEGRRSGFWEFVKI